MVEEVHTSDLRVKWLQDPGWRGIVGFITNPRPSATPTEFLRLAPEGFRICQTMTYVPGFRVRTEKVVQAVKQMEACCLTLKEAGVDVIAQAGTPYSFAGEGYEETRGLTAGLEKLTGLPVAMMGLSVVNALKQMGYRSVGVACTYYPDDLATRYTKFLEAAGMKVLAMEHWLSQGIFINREEVDRWYRQAPVGLVYKAAKIVASHCPKAECIVVSGGGVYTMDIIQALEKDLKKPVISSTAALYWDIFSRLGVSPGITGRGSLLASLG